MVEDRVARLIVEAEVRRTLAEYCQTCDDGRFDDFARCFAPDAVVRVLGRSVAGRAAIKDWIAAAMPAPRRGRHLTTNVLIVVDEGRATASSDFAFVVPGPKVAAVGRYADELVPCDGRWLIARREITLLERGGARP